MTWSVPVPTDWLYFLPIGVLGIVRWTTWLIRRIPAALYRPVRNGFYAPLSVVVPVYQEDPDIFAKAIESWLANRVTEIILVIDASDTVCQQVAARYSDHYPVTVLITDVPGKRDALRRGWAAATTPLVALVDSDVIWAYDVADQVAMPFADPRIGGVSTRQNVYNPRGFLQRVNDMYLDYRYFDENAAQTAAGRALSCISGRTAVYRRAILDAIADDFMTETFAGIPCMSGDDKCLTALTIKAGYATVLQRTARVWSTFPDTFAVFTRQRLRWARNTWRSDLRATVLDRWAWQHPFLAFTMIDKAVSSFTLLAAPTFMTLALIRHHWAFAATLATWWWLSRAVKLLPHLRRRPTSFFLIPPFVLLTFWMALVKIWALITVRQQRWLTRQVAVVDGHVTRTGGPDGGYTEGAEAPVPAAPMVIDLRTAGEQAVPYLAGNTAPGQYAPNQYAPNQYAPNQYAPNQYGPGDHGPSLAQESAPHPYAAQQPAPEPWTANGYAADDLGPHGYQPSGYQPSGYQPSGYQPNEYQPYEYPQHGYQPNEYPQNGYQPNEYPQHDQEPQGYSVASGHQAWSYDQAVPQPNPGQLGGGPGAAAYQAFPAEAPHLPGYAAYGGAPSVQEPSNLSTDDEPPPLPFRRGRRRAERAT